MRTVILFFLIFISFSVFSYSQNFFPITTGDKLQFQIIKSHDEPGYSWEHTTFEKSQVTEVNTLGHTFYLYKDGYFRYDSLNLKLYRLVNNYEKLAYDFNKQQNETDTLYFLGTPRLFTYEADSYINIGGSNRLLKKAHWTYQFSGTESGEIQIVDGIGIFKKYEYYILGQSYDVTKDLLISAIIDSSVYNPLTLSVSATFPDCLSTINNEFSVMCDINTQNLGLVETLKADVIIYSDNNIIYSENFIGDVSNEQVNIDLPSSLLMPPNYVNIKITCSDNSIFENEAHFPDTGYITVPCQTDCNSWSSLFVPGFNMWYYLSAMKFFNKNIGKIYARPGNHDNPIWATNNGGFDWNKYSSVPKYYADVNFQMIDSMYTFCLDSYSSIIRTTDGGINFQTLHSRDGNRYYSLSFINRNEGWVAVKYQESSTNSYYAILKTTDSGTNWEIISLNPGLEPGSIDFVNRDVGFLLTMNYNLYKSIDGGNTWNQISNIPDYYTLYMIDNLTGWAIGTGVSKTTDGGITWTKLQSGNYWDAVFFNSNYGWILGKDSMNQNATFYTINGGLSWVRKDFNITSQNLFIDFIDEQHGWVLFEDGTLMKTVNSGITFIKEENIKILPDNFILFQNYPNPFNPSTTINYQIPSQQFVTLKVYDVLGNEVAVLVNEEKPAGNYEVEFKSSVDSHQFASGVYYYQLKAGDFIETKKMILIK